MSTTRGLIGEFAAIMSLSQGWQVIHCPQDQIDIIAFLENDYVRVQVKASSLRANQSSRKPGYHFRTAAVQPRRNCLTHPADIIAHCFSARRVVFYAASQPIQSTLLCHTHFVPTLSKRVGTRPYQSSMKGSYEQASEMIKHHEGLYRTPTKTARIYWIDVGRLIDESLGGGV